MLSRIDLRGLRLQNRTLRELLPRAEFDVAAAAEQVRPIVEGVAQHGAQALRELLGPVRRRDPRTPARASRGPAGRPGSARPRSSRCARRVGPPGPPGPRRPAAHRRHHPRRCGWHGHRALGSGRAGRPLRARRPGRLPLQRRHERRARAAGAGRLAGRREPPAEGERRPLRRLSPPDHPRRVRPARRQRGVCRGRRPGGRHVRVRLRGDRRRRDHCLPTGFDGHRPGVDLGRRGQAAAPGPHRHRRRGRPDRDRHPRRRHRRPGPRRRRPGEPGRARPARRLGARHRQRGVGRRGRRGSRSPGARGQARRAHPPGPDRASVGGRPRRRRPAGLRVCNAYAAEHLEIQTRDADRSPRGVRTPGRSSSARTPP